MSEAITQLQRLMRMRAVVHATGLSKSSIHELRVQGKFPEPVPLPGRRVAWIEAEIVEWQRVRIAERNRCKKISTANRSCA